MKEYQWKKGTRYSGDPQIIGQRLKAIESKVGLTPENVIHDAKSKRSTLHKYFEWDDSVAATEHRKQQARHLIRAVRVVSVEEEQTEPAFVHVSIDNAPRYVDTEVAVNSDTLWNDVMRSAAIDLMAMQERLTELKVVEKGRSKPLSKLQGHVKKAHEVAQGLAV